MILLGVYAQSLLDFGCYLPFALHYLTTTHDLQQMDSYLAVLSLHVGNYLKHLALKNHPWSIE